MAKPKLGAKCVCVSCSAGFYDLQKVPAICPRCGASQPPSTPKMRRVGGNVSAVAKHPKALAIASKIGSDADTEADAVKDDEEGEEVSESDADLDDDDDVAPDELGVSVGNGEHEV